VRLLIAVSLASVMLGQSGAVSMDGDVTLSGQVFQMLPLGSIGISSGPKFVNAVCWAAAGGGGSATSVAVDMTGNGGANFFIVGFTAYNTSLTISFSDSVNGSVYFPISGTGSSPTTQFSAATNAGNAANQTFSFSVSATEYASACVYGFANMPAAPTVESNGGSDNVTTPTVSPGTITPTGAGYQLIISANGQFFAGMQTIDSSFVQKGICDLSPGPTVPPCDSATYSGGNWFGVNMSYLIQPAAATVTPTWSTTGSPGTWQAAYLVFQAQ